MWAPRVQLKGRGGGALRVYATGRRHGGGDGSSMSLHKALSRRSQEKASDLEYSADRQHNPLSCHRVLTSAVP